MKNSDVVTITCYGKTTKTTRGKALKEYREAIRYCEGSERDRYVNILMALEDGETECSDLD